jgi:branched-chain amino acid transport system ATP-binding protein
MNETIFSVARRLIHTDWTFENIKKLGDIISRAEVSRTFQNIRLLPESTVLKNVALGLSQHEQCSTLACILGLPSARRERRRIDKEALRILDDVGMAAYAGRRVSTLAYGHQRRVEIARGIAGCHY